MLGFQNTREWVYPQSIEGRFMTIRRWTFAALHLLLFAVPWIPVGGHPALLVDIPHRRLFLLGQSFTATDTLFLMLFLLFLAFSLFFFTAVFGRVWCGYACPQTVFLESWIRPLELWIEGDRTRRKRRDAAGWTLDRIWRKGVKWTAFVGVSVVLAGAMVSVFAGARPLWTGQAGSTAYAFTAVLATLWFIDFTWFREQFCNYLCPYARFQSALTDDESLLISYDESRGEPRGRGREAAEAGNCISCSKCVVVCPQGIDIREGFQLECIQCARCVDACTSVMEPLGHDTLIRYSSVALDEGRALRRVRPRTVIYGGLLVAILSSAAVLLLTRVPFEVTVNRAPGSSFVVDADGWTRNTYLVKVTNNGTDEGATGYQISIEGLDDTAVTVDPLELRPTETRTVPMIVRAPADHYSSRSVPFDVRVVSDQGDVLVPVTFLTGAADVR